VRSRAVFYLLKLPLILLLMLAGYVFEFLISLPFAILCLLDSRARR
jgi:hypothetical protein